ncbi:hypothetical protein [Microbispora sp. KK1-11]|uniref:hypothetical protein n=1 Tax=Microbispora sp. KK1-11 TaxID=2053005 RepID=UPI001158EB7C|nr:hypothetical protein [Microbispora sp. KK1-11]TQS26131.1 hypothetical protein FLW16_27105 [Microbispora sp. KK1-11]
MKDHRPERTAVFVDQSGRRARILTAAAVGGAIVVLALTLTLVSGALAGPELPPMGWLGTQGQQVVERSPTGSPTPSRRSERRRAPRDEVRASGTPRATAAPARRTPSARRPPSRMPSASPSKSLKPSTTPSAIPEPDVEISASGESTPAPSAPEVAQTTAPAEEATRTPAPGPGPVQTPPQQPGASQ